MNCKKGKTKNMPHIVLVLLFAIFLIPACSENQSREEQVREFIATAVAAGESREVLSIRNIVAVKYEDDGGRDRRNLVGLATGYFLRHKNIHLFTQIDKISFSADGQAHVKVFVAMAGSPVEGAEALLDLRADLYQFDLTLTRESDEWLLQKARWQRASIDDVLKG